MRQKTVQCYLFLCVMPCTQTGQGLNKKSQLNQATGAKMQQTRCIQNKTSTNIESSVTNDHTSLNKWDQRFWQKASHVFISKWVTESDNKKISMLWLLDDHRRVRGFNKKGGASSYPWLHYHLDDRNGCRLETKSLRLIGVTQTSCTAPNRSRVNAAANITYHHYLWFIQHVIA